MPETDYESPSDAAKSKEMRKFFRALAAVQSNAIFRVMNGKDPAHMNKLAVEETDRLLRTADSNPSGRCPQGMVWDDELQMCVVGYAGEPSAGS